MLSCAAGEFRQSQRLCHCLKDVLKRKYCIVKAETPQNEEIVLPRYIPRSPTDILRALETTINRDPTAPHFKYHDDPYLYPTSNYKKRVFALSQESGRKAALWIRQEHSNLFKFREADPPMKLLTLYKNADPPIAAYVPRINYDKESAVTEDDLKLAIQNNIITDAVLIYDLLKTRNPDSISTDTEQEFLELLCYYNETEPISPELIEEKWFKQGVEDKRSVRWKEDGLAARIFADMKEKTPAAYCTMIIGMCKHFQASGAVKLYDECMDKKIPLNVDVFNGIISVAGFVKESAELQWEFIKQTLTDMNDKGIAPNLGTLNSALESVSLMNDYKLMRTYALDLMAEFVQNCKIEPSLATWYFMLNIFYKEKSPGNNLLYKIIDRLEGQSLTIRDPKDVMFFATAMNMCRFKLQDVKLAQRLHGILLHDLNYDLMGDSYKEGLYYRNYFALVARNAPLETFMELYNDLVPNVYIPETFVMQEILRAIDAHGSTEYYPLIWSHMVMFGLASQQTLVQFMLEAMVRNLPADEKPSGKSELQSNQVQSLSEISDVDKFAKIAWDVWLKIEDVPEGRTEKLKWNATMLNDVIVLLSRAKRFDDAHKAVMSLSASGGSIGVPASSDTLIYFSQEAVKDGKPSYAVTALKFMSECGFTEAADVSVEILQQVLNRSKEEVKELAEQVANKKAEMWSSSDPTLMNLIKIANNEMVLKSEKAESSSSSSDSSDTSDDEDTDAEEFPHK